MYDVIENENGRVPAFAATAKYPLMRKRLMKMWREAKVQHSDPVDAWASIIEDADKAKSFKQARGRGGFVRSSWHS